MHTTHAVVALLLLVAACGSSSKPATSTGDAGIGDAAAPTPTSACGTVTGTCSTEGACCTLDVPDGFGPEGYRCASGTWKSDSTCVPPPAPCAAPLTGSLTRADGAPVSPKCFLQLGINGVIGAVVALEPGGQLQLYFDRVPAAGEVVPVIPYKDRQSHLVDAGASDGGANAVAMRLGRPGGITGFAVEAESASGSVTVTSIQTDASGISALHVTLDAQMSSSTPGSPWVGKLSGSW